MDVQDRLRLAHMSVCKAENERMREVFNMRTYKEGDQGIDCCKETCTWVHKIQLKQKEL